MRLKPIFNIAGVAAVCALSACATVQPPTADEDDFQDAADDLVLAEALSTTTAMNMPTTGTSTYTGQIGRTVTGDADGVFLGDLSLTADFAAATITGQATNINILSDDVEDQLVSGSLVISNGVISGTGMSADLDGTLTGAFQGLSFSTVADLSIVGDFKSSDPGVADADVISGMVSGTLDGDVYLFLTGDGGFFVCTSTCGPLIAP